MGWTPGTSVVFFETPSGVVMLGREQLKTDLVADLLAERRDAALREEVATPPT
jgi:hypothetical protein